MESKTIILTPFTGYAVVIYHLMKNDGFSFIFTDNNSLLYGKKYDGIEIVSAEDVNEKYIDAKVIVCSDRHKDVIDKQYKCFGFIDIETDFRRFIIRDGLNAAIESVNFEQLNEIRPRQCAIIRNKFFLLNPEPTDDQLIIDSVGISITSRCSLRCKDCMTLMQYYQKPEDYPLDINIKAFDVFMENVDFVREFGIFGGEPFLYQQNLPQFLQSLGNSVHIKKIGLLLIATNGTIVPDEKTLKAVKQHEIHVCMSDYGANTKNIDSVVDAFNKHGIDYAHIKNQHWHPVSKIVNGDNVSDEEAKIRYENCRFKCNTISKGKFFACAFLASAHDLQAIPDNTENYVDLLSKSITKSDIACYLRRHDSGQGYPGCRWCSGADTSTIIKAGTQIREPLPYNRYT